MTQRPRSASVQARLGRATPALAVATGLALAACSPHPYPGSSEPPPPPAQTGDLMGAPYDPQGGPPPGPPQAYAPAQPGLEAPAQPTVQAPYGGPPLGPDGSGYPSPGYGAGPSYGPPSSYAGGYPPLRRFAPGQCPPRAERLPTDGCMDPIPNPSDDEGRYVRREHPPRRFAQGYAPVPYFHHRAHAYAQTPLMHHHHRAGSGLYRYEPYRPVTRHPAHHAAMSANHPTYAAPTGKPPAHAPAKPAGKAAAHSAGKAAISTHGKGVKSKTPTLRAPVVPDASGKAGTAAASTAALAAALGPVVKARAALHADGLRPNQAGDVSLTLPPDFADGLRAEAKKNGLTDAAASANLTAALSGDGYAVAPGGSQALPLVAGQATTFKWTVTPQANAKGPLKAEVGADLLGGGVQHVDLGSVEQGSAPAKVSARVVGLTLLALIVAGVIALFAGRRRGRPLSGATKPRANHVEGRPMSLDR